MNFDDFQDAVLFVLHHDEDYGCMRYGITDVEKLQGQSYTGLSVTAPGSMTSVVVNLDGAYEEYQITRDLNEVMDDIRDAIDNGIENMPAIDTDHISDYDLMKNCLVMEMIPVEGNEEMLGTIPHEVTGDIATVYRFELAQRNDTVASILVTDSMLERYGIDEEQLHDDALASAPVNRPWKFASMSEVLNELSGGEFPADAESPFYVATTEDGIQGAAVINYPGFLDMAAARMEGDYYIVPSSVHEVLTIRDDGSISSKELNEMITSINDKEVEPKDRLSNQAYHYDSIDHVLETAVGFEGRMEELAKSVFTEEELRYQEQKTEDGSERQTENRAERSDGIESERQTAYDAENHDPVKQGEPDPEFSTEYSVREPEKVDAITCLLIQPGLYPKEVQVELELGNLQAVVGGDIEVVYPFADDAGIICNEEGKLAGLEYNRALRDENGGILDIIAGDFLITGLTEDNFGSLTPDQMKIYESEFHQPEVFIQMGRNVMAIPVSDEEVQRKEAAREDKPKEHEPKVKNPHKEHEVL